MKKTNWLIGIIVACTIVLAGCGKPEKAPDQSRPDLPKLKQAFPQPTQEVNESLRKITFGIRYGDYAQALAELEKMAASPNLSEAQKKAVSEFTEQVKKTASAKPTQ